MFFKTDIWLRFKIARKKVNDQSFALSNASLTSSAASKLVPQLIEIPLAPWP